MARPTNITLCSFCGKSHAEVKKLIAGPGVYICDSCVVVCKGVIEADIDLRSVVDAIDRARIGASGYAYVVDSHGEIIAHPDVNIVLAHTSFATLPQVQAALSGAAIARANAVTSGVLSILPR